MTDEQPLVGLGEIATFLKVGKPKARKMLSRCRAPLLPAYRPYLAVFPTDLMQALRLQRVQKHIGSTREVVE